MLEPLISEDIETFAEMLHDADGESPGVAAEALRALAEVLGVSMEAKRPHPIMHQSPKSIFPDYALREAYCVDALTRLAIVKAPESKVRLFMYLMGSDAYTKGVQAGRSKTTVNEKVYLEVLSQADEYLELVDAQHKVSRSLGIPQPHVSRSFKRLEELELLSRHGFCPETGKAVWRLETPTLSTIENLF